MVPAATNGAVAAASAANESPGGGSSDTGRRPAPPRPRPPAMGAEASGSSEPVLVNGVRRDGKKTAKLPPLPKETSGSKRSSTTSINSSGQQGMMSIQVNFQEFLT